MKRFFVFFIYFFLTCSLFAGAGVNPSDSFYNDATRWETLKIIKPLPQLRPYSISLIKSIIEAVSACELESEASLAKDYYEKEFSKFFKLNLEAKDEFKINIDEKNNQLSLVFGFDGNVGVSENMNLAYDLNLVGDTRKLSSVTPIFGASVYDTAKDPMSLKKLQVNPSCNSIFSLGSKDLYITAGISRASFGSLPYTSIVYSPETFHAPFISFVINKGIVTFTQSLFTISATDNFGKVGAAAMHPEKYLALHSFDFNLFENFVFTYYENIIYGNRFDFTYMLPVPYMVGQSFSGFRDNLQMGIGARLYTDFGAKFTADFFVDDINANDLAKLKFDTRIKAAAQLGSFFAFTDSFAKSFKTDLTLITPWMYTHEDETLTGKGFGYGSSGDPLVLGDGVNYQNYTHFGMNIANQLPQNSASLYYEINFEPAKNFTIDFFSSVIRHANINESLSEEEKIGYLNAPKNQFLTDGSVFNYPNYGSGHLPHAAQKFHFLMQATPMTISQTGLNAKYTLNTKIGDFSLNLRYMFEYINNYGVQNNIYVGQGIYDSDGKLTNPATSNDTKQAYDIWKNNIDEHKFNNYFLISIKYSY